MTLMTPIVPGQWFGRWTVLAVFSGSRGTAGQPPLLRRCACRCECGTERMVSARSLLRGESQSCGCLNREINMVIKRKHGCSRRVSGRTREYRIWAGMLNRCRNPKSSFFHRYGGRGITVCERWLDFRNFLADMGIAPAGMSLDRIDNDGNYELGNCRWATSAQQYANTSKNRNVTINGATYCLTEWCRITGVNYSTAVARHKRGCSPQEIFALPERVPNAKLTETQVRSILRDSRSARQIATDYGVGRSTVTAIKLGVTWHHLSVDLMDMADEAIERAGLIVVGEIGHLLEGRRAVTYPADDTEFEEARIDKVERSGKSWAISHDGWHLYCGDDCPIEPKPGQVARMYPGTIGRAVRGLFIDGTRIWYRTDAEEKEQHEIQMYGADAADWLRRWDAGDGVWSIEMGGLGPGYEQCIHITAAEVLRWLLRHTPDFNDEDAWPATREAISRDVTGLPAVDALGLSGAQWGAALNLACQLYRRGPREVMTDERVKDRHIQVSRNFPGASP